MPKKKEITEFTTAELIYELDDRDMFTLRASRKILPNHEESDADAFMDKQLKEDVSKWTDLFVKHCKEYYREVKEDSFSKGKALLSGHSIWILKQHPEHD